MEQYFCLRLDDYSSPGFVSADKAYFGTLEDIRGLVDALDGDERVRASFAELVATFRAYMAGDSKVVHHVAYQELPLLVPVDVLGREVVETGEFAWTHVNTWGCPYEMRCSGMVAEVLWLKTADGYLRAVRARFQNLQYEGMRGDWRPLEDGFWGFPHMLECVDGWVYGRLATAEKYFDLQQAAEEDMAAFLVNHCLDFSGFCEDIFGEG